MQTFNSFNELYQNQATVSNMAVFNVAIKDSSYLRSIRVDKKTGDLIVGFYDGAVFGYEVGPYGQALMDAVLSAPSKGKYFYHYIRTSYPFYKIRSRSPYRKRRNIGEKVADWIWKALK